MTSKERLKTALAHKASDRIAIDFGATTVTDIHVLIIRKIREYYGLKKIPVVPAPFMKHPRGIRDIQQWYMSTLIRPDFIKEIFDRQI